MHLKYTALFTSVNILLGVGPLILPMPFFNAGLGLSIIWLVLITLLSYNSAMFISQSMSKLHQIEYRQAIAPIDQPPTEPHGVGQSLITTQQENQYRQRCQLILHQSNNSLQNDDADQVTKQYDHSLQFEILYGPRWKYFPSIAITTYLTGTAITKCILTGNTLSKVFGDVNAPKVFESFSFWLLIFFLFGAIFSFKSIQKTKILQTIIIAVRAISILLFIFGSIFLIVKDGVRQVTPPGQGYFNINHFVEIFSNGVFAFLFHHSLPSIVGNLKTTEDVSFVLRYAFLISGTILLVIPLTGTLAFGSELGVGTKFIYYNFDFQNKISVVYWVTSFYVFLNIAAFSVYIIVIRTYILSMINPQINARLFSKKTLIASLAILAFVLFASWVLKDYIQIVLDFTGGIFGVCILLIMPSMEVRKARQLIYQPGQTRNYIKYMPQAIIILGIGLIAVNIYVITTKI